MTPLQHLQWQCLTHEKKNMTSLTYCTFNIHMISLEGLFCIHLLNMTVLKHNN